MDLVLSALHLVLALGLFWTCFCRQAHSTKNTPAADRMSYWLLSVASLVVAVSPFGTLLWPWLEVRYHPTWPVVLLLLAMLLIQWQAAHRWSSTPQGALRETPHN